MAYDEFVTWQAFLRRNPRGLRWDNWVQARLAQQVDFLQQRGKGQKSPKFEAFAWKPPEPLWVLRQEAEAAARAGKGKEVADRVKHHSSIPVGRRRSKRRVSKG